MAKTETLPGMSRCNASPAEIAAKQELKATLQEHRDQLPANGQGQRYYRYDDVDYILDESVKRKRAESDGDGERADE